MDAHSLSDLMDCANEVTDPRAANVTHKLNNIIVIAVTCPHFMYQPR